MKVALIVHQDNVFPELQLWWHGNEVWGTLDNFIGMIIVFRLSELIHDYSDKIDVIFTSYEEIDLGGAKRIAKNLDKDVLPIVVDVANVKGDWDCALENIYKFSNKEIKDMKEMIESHLNLKCNTRKYTGKPDDEDDSWAFIKEKRKVLTYTIPVRGELHTTDCNITLNGIEKATQGLKWLLSYFLTEESKTGR